MAQSAIRNLNGFEFGGRTLRVDKASSQADELRLLHVQTTVGTSTFETVQSANITPDKIPEVIARTIGKQYFCLFLFLFSIYIFLLLVNLPPEQVVDLMKQMQNIITEYPIEARNILIQNPQLTYAMLQSLVIMGLIPQSEAANMLHKRPDVSSINLINNSSAVSTNLASNFQTTLPVPNPNFQPTPSLIPQPTLPIVPPPSFHSHLASMNFPMTTTTTPTVQQPQTNPNITGGSPLSRNDQEKAQLLMQVLQLNDAQIAQLPADQRASIMLLRDQIQQSGMVSL
jgi:cleavage stimulation factor subunit 2